MLYIYQLRTFLEAKALKRFAPDAMFKVSSIRSVHNL